MEKYGFVYIWYDKKRKMYYLGSHWGTINDGYICSSNRMRDAYRRRPDDFKRRVIQNNVSRETLLEEEHKWLQRIQDDELGKKYYNLRKHKWGHWSTDINRSVNVKNKLIGNKNRLGKKKSKEECEKISKSLTGKIRTAESKKKQSDKLKGKSIPHYEKIRLANTGKKRTGQALLNLQKACERMRELKKEKMK